MHTGINTCIGAKVYTRNQYTCVHPYTHTYMYF